jgi:hypothetical protein
MSGFIIEQGDKIHEAFAYPGPLNEGSRQALVEYAHANYGPKATLRSMTPQEQSDFVQHGQKFFTTRSF